jgi:hypothetical protein
MEKFRPEVTFIANNKEHPEQDGFEQKLEQEAATTLRRAFDTVADVFNNVRTASTNNEAKLQAEELKKETSSALTTLYKKIGVKALKILLPAFVAGSLTYAEEKIMDTLSQKNLPPVQHLDRDKLPLTLSFVDHYISSDLVDTHNKCVEFLAKRKNGKMSKEEIAYKEKIVKNMAFGGYGDTFFSDIERLQKINSNETDENSLASRVGPEREDLLRKYLGLPQKHGTLSVSPYSPSQSTEAHKKYYEFDQHKMLALIFRQRYLADSASEKIASKTLHTELSVPPPFEGKKYDDLVQYVKKHNLLPFNYLMSHLGRYKAYVGQDKKTGETYISYYDKWDLDPPRLKVLLGIDIDQFNFPFEIYGRIYEKDFNHFIATQKS